MSTEVGAAARALPDYELGREVGRGQFGVVWSARHRQLGRDVAVKALAAPVAENREHSARFRREARMLAQIDHPHVVTVYDYREADGLRLLVMELLTGGTLADRRAAGISLETAVASTLAAASGLHHVHEQGILHRDVKPENLMFDRWGTLKVTDFGIARGVEVDATAMKLTYAGEFFGTPAYVSPEQAACALGEDSWRIDAASDQYSLAAVLYEALCDQLTHDASGGAIALCRRRMTDDPRPVREVKPDVPVEIDRVVMKALSRDPALRYASTQGFAVALGTAAEAALGADWLERSDPSLRETRAVVATTRSATSARLETNLPAPVTRFLGRRRELAEIARQSRAARLITIVGPGGVGKTRLALEAAAAQLDGSGDGVWLVELAPVSDPSRVAAAVMRALGIRDDPTRDPLDYLVEVCLDRVTLIVLDNCEHLVAAVAALADELLRRCPGIALIATSREPLNIRGEHVYRVPALDLPDRGAPRDAMLAAAAVQLFVERAVQHRPRFTLDDANAPTVANICWRLDGMPLAIELAAARLRNLSLEQLDARLDQRFRILTGGARTDEPRQQTLRALVDWSWDLLDPTERAVLARTSVFNGSFDLDAAEGILTDDADEPGSLLDRLADLVDKSLVQFVDDGRYRLLETIREFAAAKLAESDDVVALADAHLAYYVGVALEAQPHLLSHDQFEYWARLDPEHDNLTRALQYALTKTDPSEAAQLVNALRNYWSRHGLHALAAGALDAILDDAAGALEPSLHCRAMIERAWHYGRLGLFHVGNDNAEHAIQAARALDDPELLAAALVTTCYDIVGEPERTLVYADEALLLAARLQDSYLTSCALQRRAGALRESDRLESRRCIEQSLELDAAAGDQDGVAVALLNLAQLDLDLEQPESARSRIERALEVLVSYPNPTMEAGLLEVLGFIEHRKRNEAVARSHFARAFALARRAGDQAIMCESMLGLALTEPTAERAALLHGAADALLDQADSQLAPTDARSRDVNTDRLRSLLGDESFTASYARGRASTRGEIIAFAPHDA